VFEQDELDCAFRRKSEMISGSLHAPRVQEDIPVAPMPFS